MAGHGPAGVAGPGDGVRHPPQRVFHPLSLCRHDRRSGTARCSLSAGQGAVRRGGAGLRRSAAADADAPRRACGDRKRRRVPRALGSGLVSASRRGGGLYDGPVPPARPDRRDRLRPFHAVFRPRPGGCRDRRRDHGDRSRAACRHCRNEGGDAGADGGAGRRPGAFRAARTRATFCRSIQAIS